MTPRIIALKIIACATIGFLGLCGVWAAILMAQGQFAFGMLCALLPFAALILLGFLFEEVTMKIIEIRLIPLPLRFRGLYLWITWPYFFLTI